MKNLKKALIVTIASFMLFSCSKKVQTFQFGSQPYLPSSTQNVPSTESNEAVASIENKVDASTTTNEAIEVAQKVSTAKVTSAKTKVSEKPTFKQKIAQKILAKKIQKLEKGGGLDDKMKIGIVIAAVGLLLLIFGLVLYGAIGLLFTIFGLLGLFAGLLIILLSALDMI